MKELKKFKRNALRPKRIRISDIRMAVAMECLTYNDTSKELITKITRAYLKQLRKDGFYCHHKATIFKNARAVNFIIENYGTLNNTN